MNLGIAEVLDAADKQPTKEGKIKTLRENISRPLLDVLIGAYDDRVEWLLPEGPVPYKFGPQIGAEQMLLSQTRSLYLYTKGGGAPEGLTQMQRETSFVQLLESLDPRDAALLIAMKDKKLPYPTLTRNLIDEAFPNLLYFQRSAPLDDNVDQTVLEENKEQGVVKRGRGRPRKHPRPDPNAPKRPRGRPRKTPLSRETGVTE